MYWYIKIFKNKRVCQYFFYPLCSTARLNVRVARTERKSLTEVWQQTCQPLTRFYGRTGRRGNGEFWNFQGPYLSLHLHKNDTNGILRFSWAKWIQTLRQQTIFQTWFAKCRNVKDGSNSIAFAQDFERFDLRNSNLTKGTLPNVLRQILTLINYTEFGQLTSLLTIEGPSGKQPHATVSWF